MDRPTESQLTSDDFWKAVLSIDEDLLIDAKKAQALNDLEGLYVDLITTPLDDVDQRVFIAQRAQKLRQLVREYNAIKPIPF